MLLRKCSRNHKGGSSCYPKRAYIHECSAQQKAKVYVVSENDQLLDIFENSRVFFATLGYASEVILQKDKNGIGEDAVSAVIPQAAIYMPFAELVDVAKELERLTKEKERLVKELARVNGMLNNENL